MKGLLKWLGPFIFAMDRALYFWNSTDPLFLKRPFTHGGKNSASRKLTSFLPYASPESWHSYTKPIDGEGGKKSVSILKKRWFEEKNSSSRKQTFFLPYAPIKSLHFYIALIGLAAPAARILVLLTKKTTTPHFPTDREKLLLLPIKIKYYPTPRFMSFCLGFRLGVSPRDSILGLKIWGKTRAQRQRTGKKSLGAQKFRNFYLYLGVLGWELG